MEWNRDESNRCIDIALNEMNIGNYEKALKFLNKANNLYHSKRADELIELNTKLRSSSPTSHTNNDNTTQNRKVSPGQLNTNTNIPSADFTKDQLELVQKVKKCKSYYEVLSVSKEATDSDIKKAYKKLALQLHPDKNRAPGAAEAFKTVGNAVAVLTDTRKRKEYDLLGSEAASPNRHHFQSNFQRHHGHHSFEAAFERESDISAEELFNLFFGGFPAQRRHAGGAAQQRHHAQQESASQPSLAFGLILVLILISMLSSFFTSDPLYSLTPSS